MVEFERLGEPPREHPPLPRADGDRADLAVPADSRLAVLLAERAPAGDRLRYHCGGCGRTWTRPNVLVYSASLCRRCGTWAEPDESEPAESDRSRAPGQIREDHRLAADDATPDPQTTTPATPALGGAD